MAGPAFTVEARWDAEAGVYVSSSDIIGLHIEASSLDEFEALVFEHGPELILANHLGGEPLADRAVLDILPTIIFKRPLDVHAAGA